MKPQHHVLSVLRFGYFIFIAAIYFPVAGVLSVMLPNPFLRRKVLAKYCSFISNLIIFGTGIKLTIHNKQDIINDGLLVSNHLSYMDIFIISSVFPGCFVTSIELRKMPVLGQISEMAACVFVERRSRANLTEEISDMTNTLKNNIRVLLFPEGTTSNGEQVLRFKRPLFQSMIDAKKSAQPVTINYEIARSERDQIFWHSDISFFNHFYTFLGRPTTYVSLTIHQSFVPTTVDDVTTLSEKAYATVSKSYNKI